MAKVKPDHIEWSLNLDASQALAEYRNLQKENRELGKQTTDLRKKLTQLTAEGKKGSIEWKNTSLEISNNTRVMSENQTKMSLVLAKMDTSKMTTKELRRHLKELTKEFENASKATHPEEYETLRQAVVKTKTAITQAASETRSLKESFFSLEKAKATITGFFTRIGMSLLTMVTGAFRNAVNTIIDFEKENSKLAAILGFTKDGIKGLTDEARRLGATTSYTAAEVTQLQIELAKLGFSQDQITSMEAGVLKFAKAVGTDLASAAAFAGASMRIFGIDAGKVEGMLASLAIGTTRSALDFSYLQSAMSTVGPVANSFGFSIEETIALLGSLANAGFDASTAATATRNILLNLADSNGKLATALGGPVTNLDELAAGLQKLQAEGVDLSQALELTDKRSVAVFSTFLENVDTLTSLRDSVSGVETDFNAMSAEMGDNVQGALNILSSTLEGVILRFYEARGPLKSVVDLVTKMVEWVGKAIDFTVQYSGAVKIGTAALVAYKVVVANLTRIKTAYLAVVKLCTSSTLAENVANKAGTVIANSYKAALAALSLAKALLTGNITKAKEAMAAFNLVTKMNPIGLLVAAVGAAIAAFQHFRKSTDEAAESTDHWSEASKTAAERYAEQRSKIQALTRVAENENLSLNRRKKAIAELNRIIPEYNAEIDKTTGKYRASRKALDEYLVSLEKKMRYEAHQDQLKVLIADAEKKRFQADDDEEAAAAAADTLSDWAKAENAKGAHNTNSKMREAQKAAAESRKAAEEAEAAVERYEKKIAKAVEEGRLAISTTATEVADEVDTAVGNVGAGIDKTAEKTVSRLKEIDTELKKLRKEYKAAAGDAERIKIDGKITALQKEKRTILGKSSQHETGTYAVESIAEVEAPIKQKHAEQKQSIDAGKSHMSEIEYAREAAAELKEYYTELDAAYAEFAKDIPQTHTATLDKIKEKQAAAQAEMLKVDEQLRAAELKELERGHQEKLRAVDAFYATQKRTTENAVREGTISAEAAEIYTLEMERENNADRLAELERYYKEVEAATNLSVEAQRKTLEKLDAERKNLNNNLLTDVGKLQEKIRGLSTDTTSRSGIMAQFELQRTGIIQTYDEAIKAAEKAGITIVGLEEEKQRRLAALEHQQRERIWQLQEKIGMSWADEYDRELEDLKNMHDQGLIDEEQFQEGKLKLGFGNLVKYMDYYTKTATSMFSAIQDAEIATSDAKYDVLIQQAKNNGEDTAELEQEKENKKLEIQKKYADVNFAIKISQIITDTAVAIMKAFGDLGPIGGGIAAAMLTATGAAQVISAKAERDKIKNMQPGKVASSSSTSTPATATRSLTGFSEGGYTGPGGRYEVAGVVHRGEYVVPMPIMNNPRVIDAVGTIEAIRRNRSARPAASSSQQGFAEGGFTSAQAPALDTSEFTTAVRELRSSIKAIKAYVVLTDLELKQKQLADARAPFTRNH